MYHSILAILFVSLTGDCTGAVNSCDMLPEVLEVFVDFTVEVEADVADEEDELDEEDEPDELGEVDEGVVCTGGGMELVG